MDDEGGDTDHKHFLEQSNRALEIQLVLRSLGDVLFELDDVTFFSDQAMSRTVFTNEAAGHGHLNVRNVTPERQEASMRSVGSVAAPVRNPDVFPADLQASGGETRAAAAEAPSSTASASWRPLPEARLEVPEPEVDVLSDESEEPPAQELPRDLHTHLGGIRLVPDDQPTPPPGRSSAPPNPVSASEEFASLRPVSSMSNEELKQELERARDRMLCTVCLLRHKRMLLVPCRHACMCVTCAREIITSHSPTRNLCPVCRTPVLGTMEIFIS